MSEAVRFQVHYYTEGPGRDEGLHEGDVLMSNHPQLAGGSHLPDITVITPVYKWVEGRVHEGGALRRATMFVTHAPFQPAVLSSSHTSPHSAPAYAALARLCFSLPPAATTPMWAASALAPCRRTPRLSRRRAPPLCRSRLSRMVLLRCEGLGGCQGERVVACGGAKIPSYSPHASHSAHPRCSTPQEKGVVQLLMAPADLASRIPGISGTRNLADNISDLKAQVREGRTPPFACCHCPPPP
jgi:hypothetical protein